jgi:PAS domain S-box-containing protein
MRRVMHAIEQASEGIVITDRAGTILYANPSVSRQSGYAQKEILDATPRIFKSGAHDQAFYQNLWQTILAGETWRGVITNRRKDGTLYQVSAVIAPVRDEGGEIVNFVALNRDMTQELLLEAQLRQAQKLEVVGQLAGGIAHDFNNALAGVSGYADLAMLEVKPDSQLHFYLKEIRRSSDRAAGIARQLLLFSRRQKAEPQPLDLNGVVEGLSKMLRRLLGENVKIEMALAPALGIVEADPGQIEQVITNLCLNARDAMPEGGRITIATANVAANEARPPPQPLAGPDSPPRRPEGPWVLLSVSDTGTGMSPEVRSRIFEPFFTTKPPGKGTGLGLSVVHGIVLGHGGWIDVETAPGRGTTMKLFFPRAGGETKLRPDGGRDAALPRGSETILLVEDEESVRSMATRVLEQLGYRVLVAASGYEALGLADRTEGAIDLLVTDVVMPNLAGPKVAADLAARRPGLRVLFITGYAPETLGDLEASGAAVLLKPFGVGELARKVREALSVSR